MLPEAEKPVSRLSNFFEKQKSAHERYKALSPVLREPNPFSHNGFTRRLTRAEQNSTFVTTEFGRRCEDLALTTWTGKLKPSPDETAELTAALTSFMEIVFTELEEMPKREHAKWLGIWLTHALQRPVAVAGEELKVESVLRLPLLQMAVEINSILMGRNIYFPLPDFRTWGSTSDNNYNPDGLYAIQATLIAAKLICGRIPVPFTGSIFPHVYVEDPKGEKKAVFDGIAYTPTGNLLVGSPLDEIEQYGLPWRMLEIKSIFGKRALQRHINEPQKKHLDQLYGQLGIAATIWFRQNRDFPFPESATLIYLRGLYPPRRFDISLNEKFFHDWLQFLPSSSLNEDKEDLGILQYQLRLALAKAQKRS